MQIPPPGCTLSRFSFSVDCPFPFLIAVAVSLVLAIGGDSAQAVPQQPVSAGGSELVEGRTYTMEPVLAYEFRGDLRDLPQTAPTQGGSTRQYRPLLSPPKVTRSKGSFAQTETKSAPSNIPFAPMPSSIQNFAGLSFNDICSGGQCGGGWPPDTNGDVGPSHYIEAVNDAYAIYTKTGALLTSFTENQFWSNAGSNPCNGNSQGDPIVVYDQLADRWILTNFAFGLDSSGNPVSPFYECIAVSKTSDPVAGGWYFYPLQTDTGATGSPPSGTLADYPKFGIWPDCVYMAANGFSEPAGTFAGAVCFFKSQ